MQTRLSVLIITKNAQYMLEKVLQSVQGLGEELIIVDDFSNDKTISIAEKYNCRIYRHKQASFGDQRSYGLSKSSGKWVLMIDADEVLTPGIRAEIKEAVEKEKPGLSGYHIHFRNHFLGHELHYGGEQYTKLILFQKDKTKIVSDHIHEHAQVEGNVGLLNGAILHYSYLSIPQVFSKFTGYARKEAVRKHENGEKSDLGKIVLYPVHLFWARYIKDKGYKDHVSRVFLDAGFAYMEFLTYFLMLREQYNNKKS